MCYIVGRNLGCVFSFIYQRDNFSMFPAYAGINRKDLDDNFIKKDVPRICGD